MSNTIIQIFEVFRKKIPGLTKEQFLREWCVLSREDRVFLQQVDLVAISHTEK